MTERDKNDQYGLFFGILVAASDLFAWILGDSESELITHGCYEEEASDEELNEIMEDLFGF